MVIEILQSCHSLVSSRRCSFGLFIHSLFSSLPVPFPDNIRVLSYSLFSSHPIPFPNNICVFIRSLISSLPIPFPSNSVSLFVLIYLISNHACLRLRFQPNPLVLQPRDSRTRPSPVSRTRIRITLDILVCRLTTLDCVPFSGCITLKKTFSLPLNHVWRLVPTTTSNLLTIENKDNCLRMTLYVIIRSLNPLDQ